MKSTKLYLCLVVFCAIICSSCSQPHKVEIHGGNDPDPPDHQSILFLVESANVEPLCNPDELRRFLNPDEMATAFHKMPNDESYAGTDTCVQRRFHYKHWQTVHTTSRYTMELVLRIDNEGGRNYFFQLRTYTPQREVIDRLDFAVWSDMQHLHTSGTVNADNSITITSLNTMKQWNFRVDDGGIFIIDKG